MRSFEDIDGIEKLRLITNALPALISYVDRDYRYRFVNSAYERWFGISSEKIIGRPVAEIIGAQAYTRARPLMEKALAGETIKYETEVINSSGEARWFDTQYVPDLGPDNQVRGFVVLGLDVTESKRTENALRSSEALFRTLFEQAPFSTQLLSPNGYTIMVNRAWRELWGIPETLVESHILKGYNMLQDAQLEAKGILPYIRKGFEGEITSIPPICYDPAETGFLGRPRWVHAYVYPVKNAQGALEYLVLMHHDVTEQILARDDQYFLSELYIQLNSISLPTEMTAFAAEALGRHLKASRAWLSEIDDSRSIAVVRHDFASGLPSLRGTYDLSAFGAAMLADWRRGRLVKVDDVTKDPRTSADAQAHLALGIRSFVTVPLLRGGQMVAAMNVSVERAKEWEDRELALIRSFTETLWSARERARLFQEVQEAVRVRDEFISVCSHELKTPVTSLKLQFQLAERQLRKGDVSAILPEQASKRIDLVNRQLDRMSKLIDDMLDVSRVAQGKLQFALEPMELGPLVSEVMERFQEQFRALNIAVSFRNAPVRIKVNGDRFRLEQVVTNLLSNALKYGSGKPIEIVLEAANGCARLSVRDRGIGIAKESLERIFQRFERAVSSEHISGLGLGLYLTRQIVEAHAGTIRVESEPGAGSCFIVELPLSLPQ